MQEEQKKMQCPEEPFGAFADPDEALIEHARSCPKCRDYLGFVNVLRETLAEDKEVEASTEGFADRVIGVVKATSQTKSRRISDRYSKRTARYSRGVLTTFRRYLPAFAISAAAAMLFLVGSAFWELRVNRMYKWTLTRPETRREQRRYARAGAKIITVQGGMADVSGVLPDGEFYLIGQPGKIEGEICLWAYSGDQWNTLRDKVGRIDDEALSKVWEKMTVGVQRVRVDKGSMPIPEGMWRRYLCSGDRVSLLSFKDRNELWDTITLEEYLRPPVRIDG